MSEEAHVCLQLQRLQEDVRHLDGEKHEHESTIIEQQDHIEKLQDSCRELQEAAQALQQDSDLKFAASIAQMKAERKQQVIQVSVFPRICMCKQHSLLICLLCVWLTGM